jgi:hypothetical protein
VAGLCNKFDFGLDWSGRISALVKGINDYQVLLYVYQVQNGSNRNFNEIVIVLSIDLLLLFHEESVRM